MQKLYIIILFFLSIQLSASTVATVSALKGSAEIQRITEIFPVKLGSKLENKDKISTSGNSKMQIIFLDETILSIGKNSNFSIEEYLFEDTKEPVAKFGMIEGAMRVITGSIGKIAPHKFSVQTRTATIGIRGTNFTVIVSRDGSLKVYCTYGAISVTYNSKVHIIQQSYFIHISPSGEIKLDSFNSSTLKKMKKEHFGVDKLKEKDATKSDNDSRVYEESNERLDVKFTDDEVTLQDLIDIIPEYIAKESYSETDGSVIAEYSMEYAEYRGIYDTSFSNGTLNNSGDAVMTVDFGNDTSLLRLGSFSDPSPQASFTFDDVNKNHIEGTQVGANGTASGDFYTTTGNAITGSFDFAETSQTGLNDVTAQGTYDVSTSLELH